MSDKRSSKRKKQDPVRPSPAELRWWQPALVVAVSLLCYLQTTGFDFVWDDNLQILQNDRIQSFTNFYKVFSERFWGFMGSTWHYYRPLHTVSYMLFYAVGGPSPAFFHWMNILLGALTGLAGFRLAYVLFRNARIALWGSLLFAVHPMHTENIAWIAGITDLGCGLFYFLSLTVYVRSANASRRWFRLCISAVFFLAALLFKETAVTLPLLAFIMDFVFRQKNNPISWRDRILRLVPFALAFMSYLGLRYHALGTLAEEGRQVSMGAADWVLSILYLIALYVTKLVIPVGHIAYRAFKPFSQLSFAEWGPPILLLAIAIWATYRFLRKDHKLLFLASWFFLTLSPVLFISSVGQNVFCERYLYIPSFGFCLLLAVLAEQNKQIWARKSSLIAGIAILTVLGVLTIRRTYVWSDDRTLIQTTLGFSPDIIKVHQQAGIEYYKNGNLDRALEEFQLALKAEERIFFRSPENRHNSLIGIGAVHLQAKRFQQALDAAFEARDLNPKGERAHALIGEIKSAQGETDEAIKHFTKALSINPSDSYTRINLANVLLGRGEPQQAEQHFRSVFRSHPEIYEAHLGLAMCLAQLGRKDEARAIAEKVLALEPANPEMKNLLLQLK